MSELLDALLKPDKPGFEPLPARLTESPFALAEAPTDNILGHLDGLAAKLGRAGTMRDQAQANLDTLDRELGELAVAFAENIKQAQSNLRRIGALVSQINK